jgi:AhpD family alkylhydroperoxidase
MEVEVGAMAFVDAASGASSPSVTAMYAAERELWGYLPNYAALFSHEPEVMAAWRHLAGAVRGAMDRRRFELVTMAAAQARGSSYCALAHGKFLTDLFHTPDEVAALAGPEGPVDELDAALVAFARQVAAEPSMVESGDLDVLRRLGLEDRELFLVVAAVGARCFFATVLDALGAEPDGQLGEVPEDMRLALTVGRPVAGAPSA